MLTKDRFHGALLGLAVGDALGTTLEFKPPGSFEPLTDMVGGGPFGLARGVWTDDTAMALCLADSLLTRGALDPQDLMQRWLRWRDEGLWSATGQCFDIGVTTSKALSRFRRTGDPFAGSDDPQAAGNGGIMRLAPVPMRYALDPVRAITLAADSSRTTHAARTCVDAARYFAGLIVGALNGTPKAHLLAPDYSPVPGLWESAPLCQEIATIAAGSFRAKSPPAIRGTGYVVAALEAALWAFAASDDYASGALLAVNLGDDADTTGAIFGQLAGAHYGVDAIPSRWREPIAMRDAIIGLADGLYAAATDARSGKGAGAGPTSR